MNSFPTCDQLRAARVLLGMGTSGVAAVIGCSRQAIHRLESKPETGNWKIRKRVIEFYEGRGVAYYAGGVILADKVVLQVYADPLRERLRRDGAGSAYLEAFDKIVEMAAVNAALIEEIESS